ncbi:MAG: membrane-bound lytic murein transglycosylase MltF [Proteobacteria bacterium]|nr:membrane-bound lytic murein transglycosylase MltF [Pseudomonadota bacterium]
MDSVRPSKAVRRRGGRHSLIMAWVLAGSALLAALWAAEGHRLPNLRDILSRKALNVATLNGPTTYYLGAHGPQGQEYSLATAFAQQLGVKLNLYTVSDVAALREELRSGRADIVAAGITPDEMWTDVGVATVSYQQIAQWVVASRGTPRAHGLGDLADRRIAIPRTGSQMSMLEGLRAQGAPDLQWDVITSANGEPLDLLTDKRADFAVVDATQFAYLRHLFPEVEKAFELPQSRSAYWMVQKHSGRLLSRINTFFGDLLAQNKMAPLLAAATPASPEFELQMSQRLQRDLEVELPALRPHFEEASQQTGVDWRLLAALGYVESKWQPQAASADGAEGVMMLTRETASQLGVSNRNDARQSILAGARYFVKVREQIPERIAEPDRSWFALAAYNVGYGHLEDARRLAQVRGGNPDVWVDVQNVLPLLAHEEYYAEAKHGFARGWEPAQMVNRVQRVLKLLEWQGESLSPAGAKDGT